MEQKSKVEKIGNSGIMCDNPGCSYLDKTVSDDNLKEWINIPCPLCGENLLTQEDYDNSQFLLGLVDTINGMSEEEMDTMIKELGSKGIKPLVLPEGGSEGDLYSLKVHCVNGKINCEDIKLIKKESD